jgi:hypothetical protein
MHREVQMENEIDHKANVMRHGRAVAFADECRRAPGAIASIIT